MNTTWTMYVLVRLDLSDSYRMAQGTHAVVQFAVDHTDWFTKWDNSRIVFLGVHRLKELDDMHYEIMKRGIPVSLYREPDMDNQQTALACVVDEYDSKMFGDLKVAS